MKLWRLYLVSALMVLPVAVLVIAGIIALWRSGTYVWLWWLLPLCWLPVWLLARRWRWRMFGGEDPLGEPAAYWTPRDKAAWELVEAEQKRAVEIPPEQLVDPHFYLQSALDLGLNIARHYRPQAKNPLGSRTVLEILSVAQLALDDSHRWIADYVPGSHLLTVDQWRVMTKAPRWLRLAGNVGWAVSIAANPLNVTRLIASELTFGQAAKEFQDNAAAWLYAMFLGRVGFYLIEMNSGRLRGDPQRYRRLTRPQEPSLLSILGGAASRPPGEVEGADAHVVITVVGQVKAGKSSLINALVGEQAAEVDVLPATSDVRQHRLKHEESDLDLVLLDTPGYADSGATSQQLQAIRTALAKADLVLLVLKVVSPARQADLAMLGELQEAVQAQPNRKPAPILGVLTHIDQLSPVMEWSPPYNWSQPTGRKEEQIREAVHYHSELFGTSLAGLIPVCSDMARQRAFGVQQWLLPAMVQLLGEARGCAVLRILHDESRRGQVKRVFKQIAKAGAALLGR